MKPEPRDYHPPLHTGLDIVFKDEHLLVVNKPAGLLSVPGRGPDKQDCMLHRLQAEYPEALTVHRLDMETSGLLLFARNPDMHRQSSILFQDRKVKKEYIALVCGKPENQTGQIKKPLITDWENRPRQKVDYQSGKESETHYNIIQYYPEQDFSRVALFPITGRSHQLRVHMQAIGHTILGDYLYGFENKDDTDIERLKLHACQLKFTHPATKEELELISPAPF